MARSRICVDPRRQRGAVLLLLLAVASTVFAALLISAFGGNTLERAREQRTLAVLAEATDALVGFAATHGRLPRPAISATDGRERDTPCTDEAACSGFLPWVTLAVDGADSWGKRLRYSVTPRYTAAPIQRLFSVATKRVQTRDGNGALRYEAGYTECLVYTQCAPAVVYSQGRDNLGTNTAGLPQANGSVNNTDEQGNDVATTGFIRRPASTDPAVPGGPFDDLVVYISLDTLYERMAAARVLP
ncbi:hypothetical protein IP92_04670 [Pseudoduganella flava]|uniref:Type II secretion system protein n=1 Tax=Pseudoduganella flava TaxID=871742 RepID=A0A562PI75_9BURK|nr:hypothetical protein [Pseudoduganella flava]QGZ42753.1 hypothetical protein GO485_29425 [Pseudoduganella flava]TWI44151.1 hypothetical protein IP92_04670 [Pseudoduganella flava]